MSHKIMLIDDDNDILELLQYNLEKDGYVVKTVSNSENAIDVAYEFLPDLIILDIMMPKVNGLELCLHLRSIEQFKNTYIFFLTAKSEKFFQEEAFENGGDDLIEKITGLRTLTHKISTVLKKNLVIRKGVKEIKLGDLTIDRPNYCVFYKGRKIYLSRHEFELLYFLVQNPKKTINRESILHNIWGSDIYLFAKSIDTYVNSICHKIGKSLITKTRGNNFKLESF